MRWIAGLLLLTLVGAAHPARAADDALTALTQSLVEVRKTHGVNQMRDAGPELNLVKQRLREWVEGYLPPEKNPEGMVILPSPVDLRRFSAKLDHILDEKGLTCGDFGPSYRCQSSPTADENERGYVGQIRLSTADSGRYLVVVTAVGILCGYDESAYVYRRDKDHKWKLLFQSEQDRYGDDEYDPRLLLAVDVSPSGVAFDQAAGPPLILTLGQFPWCQSNWQSLSTRLWRASETSSSPKPLLDRHDTLYIGDYEIASARLTSNDALIEFTGQSLDSGVLIRRHVLHYRVLKGDKLERIAPAALDPNDFAEEWLISPWSEAGPWVEPKQKGVVTLELHEALSKSLGEFDGPARRCRSDPTLWQVSFSAEDERPKDYTLLPPTHFLVRWMPPYRFSLVALGRKRFPGCDEKVDMPDNLGTLFPTTDGKQP